MSDKADPVEQLGKELAADHTIDKATRPRHFDSIAAAMQADPPLKQGDTAEDAESGTRYEFDGEEFRAIDAEPESADSEPATEPDAPVVIGDFDSFDAVREFAESECVALVPGCLAVVNGALVRLNGKGDFVTVLSDIVAEYELPGLHNEAHEREMQEVERVVLGAAFESGSLLGDLRDLVLGLYKSQRVLWSGRSQAEQRDLAKQVEGQCKTILRKVARVVAEGETIAVQGKLEKYSHGGSAFDLKLSAASDEGSALELFRMVGHEVVIVSADSERFMNADEPVVDLDEPGLPLDEADELDEADDADEAEPVSDDDSDLAGDEADDERPADERGAEAASEHAESVKANDPEPGDYEARQNPDDDFEEASDEELAAQRDRGQGDKTAQADYIGPREPLDAVPGESWIDTSSDDERPKFKNPNGRWYLKPPRDEELEEWRASQAEADEADAEDAFPDSPEA